MLLIITDHSADFWLEIERGHMYTYVCCINGHGNYHRGQ